MYSDSFVVKLMEEEGLSFQEAVRIAATEMEGAHETEEGVHATQTYCHILNYPESGFDLEQVEETDIILEKII
jgi:hypothetical protein